MHILLGTGDVQLSFSIIKDKLTKLPQIPACTFGFVEHTPQTEAEHGVRRIEGDDLKIVPPVALHFMELEDIDKVIESLQHFKQKIVEATIAVTRNAAKA